VRYVGYGRDTDRATSHLAGSHNAGLNEFLAARDYRIEIAGPFDSELTGLSVETALISALKPDLNIDPGRSEWRFRPLGVPVAFAERQVQPELGLMDFVAAQGDDSAPVLFVIVTRVDFPGDRVGYDPAQPPSDEDLRLRVDRWWQLQRWLPEWTADPASSPGLLVGVFGSPGRQMVIASARVDRGGWASAERQSGGLVRIPLLHPEDLDAFSLRGRRIARDAGIRFGSFSSQFFVRLGVDGRLVQASQASGATSNEQAAEAASAAGEPGLVCGVDGCPAGWVAVWHDLAGGDLHWEVVPRLADLVAGDRRPRVIAVDVPIGLLGAGARRCDVEARARLGGARGASVFPAPIRPVLAASSHVEANEIRRAVEGKGMSVQAWGIAPKVREADEALRGDPALRRLVREVHPELCFAAMDGGRPMAHSKKFAAGRAMRIELLRRSFGAAVDEALASKPRGCAVDDLLDAFACAWTAARIVSGTAEVIPAQPPRDEHGLPMEMVT